MTEQEKKAISAKLYLNCKNRTENQYNEFSKEELKLMKWLFASIYMSIVNSRGAKFAVSDKEKAVLAHIFDWMVCLPTFEGDLKKGLYLMSSQGFGKDVFLRAIVRFFEYFGKMFKEYTFHDFNHDWFDKGEFFFKMPIKINDINETGRIKRERSSIPFLEFLDYREQVDNRRGIIVSTNFGAKRLQDALEFDSQNPRLYERIKEVFNIIVIGDSESKRVENKITI